MDWGGVEDSAGSRGACVEDDAWIGEGMGSMEVNPTIVSSMSIELDIVLRILYSGKESKHLDPTQTGGVSMNNRILYVGIILILLTIAGCASLTAEGYPSPDSREETIIPLPAPQLERETSIEEALLKRRSVREYSRESLSLAEIGQLLWAAQGITSERGYRTAPSAGGLYPLELYLLAGDVEGLIQGIYRYIPQEHTLLKTSDGDNRDELQGAALGQSSVGEGCAVIVITAVYERTTGKYGNRGIRYVHMEVGSAAENIYLQAVSLDLGTVFIGAFDDEGVKAILKLDEAEQPLGLMPVGKH